MLERELAHLEQGGDVEVEDKYILSCFQLRDELLLRQAEWRDWDPSMKPQPGIKIIGCVNDHLQDDHICKIIQGDEAWFSNNFGCDYGQLMDLHFDIKRDLPEPYYKLTDTGIK